MWGIERALAYAFIAAVGLNFINVIGRYGFGSTILSADELQIYIMVFMTFLGAAVVAWRNQPPAHGRGCERAAAAVAPAGANGRTRGDRHSHRFRAVEFDLLCRANVRHRPRQRHGAGADVDSAWRGGGGLRSDGAHRLPAPRSGLGRARGRTSANPARRPEPCRLRSVCCRSFCCCWDSRSSSSCWRRSASRWCSSCTCRSRRCIRTCSDRSMPLRCWRFRSLSMPAN